MLEQLKHEFKHKWQLLWKLKEGIGKPSKNNTLNTQFMMGQETNMQEDCKPANLLLLEETVENI